MLQRIRECLESVRADVEARQALTLLARKTERSEELLMTTFAAFTGDPSAQRGLLGVSDLPPSRRISNSRELLKYAKCFQKDAGVIEKLNAEEHWHERRAFEELPRTLKAYAENLRLEAPRRQRREREWKPANVQRRQDNAIVAWMYRLTGHYYREKVAAILRAAGLRAVEAETMRKREWRKRGDRKRERRVKSLALPRP